MLPGFVIGLREAMEAALIVGIVAAFLVRSGRADRLGFMWLGVGLAVVASLASGLTLSLVAAALPPAQQEGLETVIGVVAVLMVTYMVVWMKRHSRDLKRQLEGVAAHALTQGSAWALVVMAFLAVLREGFETAVFLVAAFDASTSRQSAGAGALLGIAIACGLGYGIYRGGVRINLSRFFRVTGLVLVLVAAGLVQTSIRTAHEAGWLNVGQQSTVDLSAVIAPGTVRSALLTGMLGIQPQPKLIELIGWLLYLIPVGLFVAWPAGRTPTRRFTAAMLSVAAIATAAVAAVLLAAAPSAPGRGSAVDVAVALGDGVIANGTVRLIGGGLQVSAVDATEKTLGPPRLPRSRPRRAVRVRE